MKTLISSVVAVLVLATTVNAKDTEAYYATVNGEKITKTDIAIVLQDPRVKFESLPKNAQNQVIEQIINKKLVSKMALNSGIENDPVFKENVEKIKMDLAFQVWQKNEVTKIKISDKELKDFYEKNKKEFKEKATSEARHILLKTEDEAKALIKELDAAKEKEAKFIELAKTKSTGPSGPKGGYLGKFGAGQMVPEFETATNNLKKGEYSKTPVKTQFGFHVIYLIDKQEAKSSSFNEVKDRISQILLQNKYNNNVQKLIEKLRKNAKIVIK
jgi:parvulin-like peptidyl-prolyl isomerase